MRVPLPFYRFRLFFLIVFIVGAIATESFAQNPCDGSTGTGITGGAISVTSGFYCANIDAMMGPGSGAVIDISANQVRIGDIVRFEVNWDDGSAPEPVIPIQTGLNTWLASGVKHYFPVTGANVKCEYIPRVTLIVNGAICTVNHGTPPKFTRWNVDNENTGVLRLTETVTNVNEYLVCKGYDADVTFTDRSTLNCVPPEYPFPPNPINDGKRWRRFTYGTANTVISATGVEVSGVVQVYPFQGIVDEEPASATVPVPLTETLLITVPADAQVGAVFQIMVEYWNTCNPYDDPAIPGPPANPITGDNQSVFEFASIRVVDQPPAPTPNNQVVCNGTNPLPDFSINLPGGFGGSTVRWYSDAANLPGAVIPGFTGTSIPALSAIPTLNNTTAGVYQVWASYYGVNNVDGISCESPRIPVTLTIKEALVQPSPLPATSVCNFDVRMFTLPNLPDFFPTPIGGGVEYEWIATDNANNPVGDVTLVPQGDQLSVEATFNLGGAFVTRTRKIRVRRVYSAGISCPSPYRDIIVTVYGLTQVGSTAGGGNFCEGSDVGSIVWTPGRGNVIRWDVSFNGGLFIDSGLGNSSTITPGALPAGNYIYHALIQNGPCAIVTGNDIAVNVSLNPTPADAGPDQPLCGTLSTSFNASNAAPGVGTWTIVSKPAAAPNPVISNINDRLATVSIAAFTDVGLYTFRWTVVNGSCTSTDDVTIDFGGDPTDPVAGLDKSTCGEIFTMEGNTPTVGVGTWTVVSGPGACVGPACPITIVNPSLATTDIQLNGPAFTYGAYTLRWTIQSGTCPIETDDVVITFSQSATATVNALGIQCVDGIVLAPIAISGTVGGAGTQGQWVIVSGTGTFDNGGSPGAVKPGGIINDNYKPSAADFTAGSVQIQLVALDPDGGGICASVNSPVLTLNFDRVPSNISAGPDQPLLCTSTTSLAALLPVDGTGSWSDPMVAGAIFSDPNVLAPIVSNLPLGATTLRWTVNSSGGVCAPVFDDVIVTVNPLPSANNLTPEVCEATAGTGNAFNIILTDQDNSVTGGGANAVEWFTDPVPAGPILPANAPQNMNSSIATSLDYYVRVTDAVTTCQNTASVVYIINPLPVASDFAKSFCEDFPVGSNQTTGIDLDAADIIAGVTGGAADRSVTWWEDATANTTAVATPNAYTINGSHVVYARVRNTITGCEDVAMVNLNIIARPLDQPIQGKAVVCASGLELYQVSPVAGATYTWTIPDPPFQKFLGGGVNDALALIEFPIVSSDVITLTISVNGCDGNLISKPVDVSPVPTPFVINGPGTICENETGVAYSVAPNNFPGSSYNWQISPVGSALVANGQTSGNVLINFLSTDISITVTESNSSNCFGPPVTIPVIVHKRPELADIVAEVCSDNISGITLTESATSAVLATTYNITSVAVAPGLIPAVRPTGVVAANGIFSDIFENTTGGPLLVRYTVEPVSADGCPGPAKIVELTVKPKPVLDPFLGAEPCSGSPTNLVFKVQTGSVAADQYIIDAINTGGLAALAGNPQTGTFLPTEIADDIWQNTTAAPVDVIYTVRPINSISTCVGNPPVDVRVKVYPEPQVTAAVKTICSGEKVNQPLIADVGGATFSWTVKSVSAGITGAVAGMGNTINDILINNTGAPGTVVYAVTATNPILFKSCMGPPQDITITVNAAPSVIDYTETVCSDAAGGNTVMTDLMALQPSINGDGSNTFVWYTTSTAIPGTEIPTPAAYTMVNNIPVYVKVTNPAASGSCPNIGSATFTVNPNPEVLATSPTFNGFEIKCSGDNNARIEVSASKGTGPYLFSINGGAFVSVTEFINLSPSPPDYIISVEDDKGCIAQSAPLTIHEPSPLDFTEIVTDVSCKNGVNGAIEITASGGIAGTYQYAIDGGPLQATNKFTGLAADIYTMKITDANGCIFQRDVTVAEPTQVMGTVTAQTNPLCFGGTGSVTVDGSGGTGTYQYSINGGVSFQVSGTFSPLLAGSSQIIVADQNGCLSLPVPVTITQPDELKVAAQTIIPVNCFGESNGSVTLIASGGVGGYTYSNDNITFTPANTFPNLPANTYTYHAKDANNCVADVAFTVTEPSDLTLSLLSKEDLFCFNVLTGKILVQGGGGAGDYEYSLDDGASDPFKPFNGFSGLDGGTYNNITVQDKNGCKEQLSVTIDEPTQVQITNVVASDAACYLGAEGTITISAIGGTPALTYVLGQDPSNTSGFNSGAFTGVRAGTYTIIVRDQNNCGPIQDLQVDVGQPTQLKVTANVTTDYNGYNVSCKGANDGVIVALVSGGTGPNFTYTISPDPAAAGINNTGTFTDLPSDFYTVTAMDNNNCPATAIPVYLKEPIELTGGNIGPDQAVCLGSDPAVIGELVPAFGGIGSYQYQWLESADGVAFNAIVGATDVTYDPPSTIIQDTYFKRTTSSGSCPPVESGEVVKLTVNPLPTVTIAASKSPVCEGGSFTVDLNFTGLQPFRYDYNSVDANGTTTNFTNLVGANYTPRPVFDFQSTTTYTVTRVRDFNGCEILTNTSVIVPVTVIDPSFTILAPAAQCSGSTYTFQWRVDPDVKYTWLWPDGTVENIVENTRPLGLSTIDHPLTNGLTSASIFLPVILQAEYTAGIDACATQSSQTVEVYPDVNAMIPPVDNVICSGDMISFGNATQGATIHKWFYREKGTTDENSVMTTSTVDYTFTNNSTQNPIIYEVVYEGSNANGCADSQIIEISVYKKSMASFAEGVIPPYQGGASTVDITNTSSIIDPTDFSYAWSFGVDAAPLTLADDEGPDFSIVYSSPGNKRVILTVTNRDEASCTTTFEKTLLVPIPPFSALFTATPLASCLPATIVVDNLSGAADSFTWDVRDETNNQVATSNLNEPSFEINSPGVYTINLTAKLLSTNQTATYSVSNIEVYGNPQAIFAARFTEFFVPDTPNDFFNDSQGANFYEWDFGDGGTSNAEEPRYLYQQEGKYLVVLIAGYNHGMKDVDGDGQLDGEVVCRDTASVEVTAREGGATKIPNAFTPNPNGPSGGNGETGINDVFLPITSGVQEFLLQIFDRWGNLLFESKDKNQGWDGYDKDGRLMPAGVYVYKLVLRLADDQRETQIGDVTLIR